MQHNFELLKAPRFGFTERRPTQECVGRLTASPHWGYVDKDVERLLPTYQEGREIGAVGVYTPLRGRLGFTDMAASVLGVPIEGVSRHDLAQLLKAGGHTLCLSAVEQLFCSRAESEAFGLTTATRANFLFVENADGTLSVLQIMISNDQWFCHLHPFGLAYGWGKADRLVVRECTKEKL